MRQVEALVTVRQRNLASTPVQWSADPRSGLSLTAAAAVSIGVHAALAGAAAISVVPAVVVGAAGLAWSASSAMFGSKAGNDARVTQMSAQINAYRAQLAHLERELFDLEIE
jgi:hypothetical protein